MLELKIHDVMHDRYDDVLANDLENYIQDWVESSNPRVEVHNVRIANGHRNSPIFIQLDESSFQLSNIESIARSAVRAFSQQVEGVSVDAAIRSRNLMVRSV